MQIAALLVPSCTFCKAKKLRNMATLTKTELTHNMRTITYMGHAH